VVPLRHTVARDVSLHSVTADRTTHLEHLPPPPRSQLSQEQSPLMGTAVAQVGRLARAQLLATAVPNMDIVVQLPTTARMVARRHLGPAGRDNLMERVLFVRSSQHELNITFL